MFKTYVSIKQCSIRVYFIEKKKKKQKQKNKTKKHKHERPKDVWQTLKCVIQNGVIKNPIQRFIVAAILDKKSIFFS